MRIGDEVAVLGDDDAGAGARRLLDKLREVWVGDRHLGLDLDDRILHEGRDLRVGEIAARRGGRGGRDAVDVDGLVDHDGFAARGLGRRSRLLRRIGFGRGHLVRRGEAVAEDRAAEARESGEDHGAGAEDRHGLDGAGFLRLLLLHRRLIGDPGRGGLRVVGCAVSVVGAVLRVIALRRAVCAVLRIGGVGILLRSVRAVRIRAVGRSLRAPVLRGLRILIRGSRAPGILRCAEAVLRRLCGSRFLRSARFLRVTEDIFHVVLPHVLLGGGSGDRFPVLVHGIRVFVHRVFGVLPFKIFHHAFLSAAGSARSLFSLRAYYIAPM